MKKVVFCLVLSSFFFHLYAQKSNQRPKTYKVWVELKNKQVYNGYLLELSDSVISIVDSDRIDSLILRVTEINQLKFRRKGRVGRSIGLGAAGGFLVGAISGYASGDDEPNIVLTLSAEEKSIVLGTFAVPFGAGVGAIIGVIKKKYPIEGDLKKYAKYRTEMNKFIVSDDQI